MKSKKKKKYELCVICKRILYEIVVRRALNIYKEKNIIPIFKLIFVHLKICSLLSTFIYQYNSVSCFDATKQS